MAANEAVKHKFALLIVAFALLTFPGGSAQMDAQNANDAQLAEITKRLEAGDDFEIPEIIEYQKNAGIIPEIVKSLPTRSAAYRLAAAQLLLDLGRPPYQPEEVPRLVLAPYVSNSQVMEQLVRMLDDPDGAVRNFVCRALAQEALDALIRNHTADILTHLRRHPETDEAVLLLGKTGAEVAAREILSNPVIRDADSVEACLALARLGNRQQEDYFLQAYKKASRPRELEEAAHQLGYIGTLRAALTLAQDMRNPGVYVWLMKARRSVRVHVIEGLHLIFPTEPILFKPVFKPENDGYYEAIENWITQNLGITWNQPRPPFLYEEDAPIPP
jgi:hypothetical protein